MFYPAKHATQKAFCSVPFNILTAATHERFETGLTQTNHNFYAFFAEGFKPGWNADFAPIPSNYVILDKIKQDEQIPPWLRLDFILSQNKFGHFQVFDKLRHLLQIPMVSLEHTLPSPTWPSEYVQNVSRMKGDVNVYITEYSKRKWLADEDAIVINHAVDSDLFTPGNLERKNHILTVANDYIGRDWCLNFAQYKKVCLDARLPVMPVGDTRGLSVATKNTAELVNKYQTSRIFLNTAHVSPIPTSLLEAMSCGCAVVSCNTCAIPEYITHGKNGFLANDNVEMSDYLALLLKDESLASKMGQEARKTIQDKCNLGRFINNWNDVFNKVSTMKILR